MSFHFGGNGGSPPPPAPYIPPIPPAPPNPPTLANAGVQEAGLTQGRKPQLGYSSTILTGGESAGSTGGSTAGKQLLGQ